MRKVIVWFIKKYQIYLSPDTGVFRKTGLTKQVCAFYPTCSEYTILVVEKHGVLKGLYKGGLRILRCHPWQKNHIDPPK